MNGYTSGTQALQGRTVNHDPEPWLTPWEDSERARTDSWAHYRELAPRPEYTVLDNPILSEFRAAGGSAHEYLGDMEDNASFREDLEHDFDPETIEHARRVLKKLAALDRTED